MKIKKIRKLLCLFLIITVLVFSLSGCFNAQNIDHLAYVVAIGFDIGENNKLKLSFQISVPSNSTEGGGSSQSNSSVVTSIECASFDSGVNILNSYLSKDPISLIAKSLYFLKILQTVEFQKLYLH